MTTSTNRTPWFYQQSIDYMQQIAGYRKAFAYGNVSIDLVTVKVVYLIIFPDIDWCFQGAGHLVPTDRPAVALLMIDNFIKNLPTYATIIPYDTRRQPLLPQYQPPGNVDTTTTVTSAPPSMSTASNIQSSSSLMPMNTTTMTTTTMITYPSTTVNSAHSISSMISIIMVAAGCLLLCLT
jgi:hypothetical protein